jgi:gamma-glutamyl-gamma-aminobutyrate hydrolase PuuD
MVDLFGAQQAKITVVHHPFRAVEYVDCRVFFHDDKFPIFVRVCKQERARSKIHHNVDTIVLRGCRK